MAVALASARLSVAPPERKARRFGLLSVVDLVDGGDPHWMIGGITSDGESCSSPRSANIVCGGPSAAKTPGSWYDDLDADPWLAYMYETCKTVGRYAEASSKLRARFLAAEQSAVERGFADNVLSAAWDLGAQDTVGQAIGRLEAQAGETYGGQVTIHLPFMLAEEAQHAGMFERVDGHLETVAGNLVSIGNYLAADATAYKVWATGATTLYRSPVVEAGPVLGYSGGLATNDYYTLVERTYGALVDCFMASATAALCGC